jgi:hypothetical protein
MYSRNNYPSAGAASRNNTTIRNNRNKNNTRRNRIAIKTEPIKFHLGEIASSPTNKRPSVKFHMAEPVELASKNTGKTLLAAIHGMSVRDAVEFDKILSNKARIGRELQTYADLPFRMSIIPITSPKDISFWQPAMTEDVRVLDFFKREFPVIYEIWEEKHRTRTLRQGIIERQIASMLRSITTISQFSPGEVPSIEEVKTYQQEAKTITDSLLAIFNKTPIRETEDELRSAIQTAQIQTFALYTKLQSIYNPLVIKFGYPDSTL